MRAKKRTVSLFRILGLIARYPGLVAVSVLGGAGQAAATLAASLFVGYAVNAIQGVFPPGSPELSVGGCCGVIGGMVVMYFIAGWLTEAYAQKLAGLVCRDIRTAAFSALADAPFSYLDKRSTGDLLSRVIVDADAVGDATALTFTNMFSGFLTILGAACLMLWLNWEIGLLIVGAAPLSASIAAFVDGKIKKHFAKQVGVRGESAALAEEAVSAHALYAIYGYGERARARYAQKNAELEKASVRATFYSSLPNPCSRLVNNLVYAGAGFIGIYFLIAQKGGAQFGLTVGVLTSFLTFALKYAKPFNDVADAFTEIQGATASGGRVFDAADAPREAADAQGAAPLTAPSGEFAFRGVSFAYNPGSRPALTGVDVGAPPGKTVALVGRTGCGKTTMINLLMRFYDPTSGSVEVSGQDARSWTTESLRSSIALVLQDSYVFTDSVRANVAIGRPGAPDTEIEACARVTRAWDFIERLPRGLDTVLGREASLSEGEKQLLCITRAMLNPCATVVLDEATSSVDPLTEIRVQRAFAKLTAGKTCLVVAHRLSTIRNAYKIYAVADGKVVESGTHESLLALRGLYYELYMSQFASQADRGNDASRQGAGA